MEKEIKNVSLSFCCKEDWNGFTSIDDRTRFCGSCQHKVVDFTNTSQSDFNQLMNSGQKICGRFKESQLSESFLKIAAASLVVAASASSLSCGTNEENIVPQSQHFEAVTLGIVVGMPVVPFSLEPGSHNLPIIVGDAPKGEEPLRYNPAIPKKGFYKKK